MKKENNKPVSDLEKCRRKIRALLEEYNCAIETDDFHWCWLRDRDTNETTSIEDK